MDDFDTIDADVDMPELDSHLDKLKEAVEDDDGVELSSESLRKTADKKLLRSDDLWNEPAETSKAPKKAADDEDETPGEELETEASEEEPAPKGKTFVFKAGAEQFEVGENATVPVKVDGKTVEVPITELLTNYSGKTAWDKRFSDLTNEKRAFTADRQKFVATQQKSQAMLEGLHKNISGGDTFGAIGSLIQLSGLEGKVDPRKYVAELRNALFEQAKAMANMTPEELAQAETREEIEYNKKQLAELRQHREREQAEYASQVEFAKKMQSEQMSIDEVQEAHDYLMENGGKHNVDLQKMGPDGLLAYAKTVREYKTAIGALSDVSPEIAENRQYQEEAVRLLRAYPGTTKEQLAEVFRDALGQKRSASVSKKVAKSPTANLAAAKARGVQTAKPKDRLDLSKITEDDLW